MTSALASADKSPQKRPRSGTRQKLLAILTDAVEKKLLFPSATNMLTFTEHRNKNQQQFSVQTEAGALFIKCQTTDYQPHFAAEQSGLLAMMETQTIAVCAPLAQGIISQPAMSYLILQHIPLAVHGDWFSAGQQLAQMHQNSSENGQYGFSTTTYCGETAQDNSWNNNWSDFFINQRLRPIFNQLKQAGTQVKESDLALEKAVEILHGHQPQPSLLHGDLWSGNIGFNPDRQLSYPVLFDPSAYYGDAETDLAMTELFGRFPQKFYQGYQSVRPLAAEYNRRMPLYQLYHLLNHALLFGGGYLSQAITQIYDL